MANKAVSGVRTRNQHGTVGFRLAIAVAILPLSFSLAACDWFAGKLVVAEFRSVEGLEKGAIVYMAGVRVGTAGEATIVEGRAQVPVHLRKSNTEILPRSAVFAIAPDPADPEALCLVIYEVPSVSPRFENGAPIYAGVSSELELSILMSAERARELWALFNPPVAP